MLRRSRRPARGLQTGFYKAFLSKNEKCDSMSTIEKSTEQKSVNQQLPPSIPMIKVLPNLKRLVENPLEVWKGYIEEYGDIVSFNFGGSNRGIMSIHPEFSQHILQKNNKNYIKSKVQTELLAQYLGKGLLTADGEYWLRQRRLIQPGFHRAKLAALTDIMQQVIDDFMVDLEAKAEGGKEIEMAHEMMELAFRVVAKSLFGTETNDELLTRLGDRITVIQKFLVRQVRQPYLRWWFNWSGKTQTHLDLAEDAGEMILQVIGDRRKSKEEYDDLLDMLLSARYEDTGEGMTDRQLLEECMVLFAAGHETSANSLVWTLYLFTQHPEVVQKIREELAQVIGNRKIAFEDLRQLEYITQVVKESMRMYPPAWVTDRLSVADDEILGYKIPKDTVALTFIYGAHHNPKVWDQPEEFRPERFTKENMKDKHKFSYFPFGGGPRLCIGNNFAMMEMQLAIASLVQKFDFKLVENQQIEMQPLVTLRPKYGIKMRLRKK